MILVTMKSVNMNAVAVVRVRSRFLAVQSLLKSFGSFSRPVLTRGHGTFEPGERIHGSSS
jgi:hypothetical protein